MKKFCIVLLMLLVSAQKQASASPNMGVSFQVFYNELSPFGDWVMDPAHGYVWIPYVDNSFHPYATNGYWAMTNFGNTWISHYSWGWAPFHYGRWFWTDFYGWAWVPGYEWGPAWVNWRTGGGFYGWAPLVPGFGVHVSVLPSNYYVFVPQRRFRDRHFHRYYVHPRNVINVYNRTTIINNTYVYNNRTYIAGPERREVERATRSRVPVYQVADAAIPGRTVVRNNNLELYRPEVNTSRSSLERPERAVTAEEYKRSGRESRNASAHNGTVHSRSVNGQVQPNQSRDSGSANRSAQPSRQGSIGTQSPPNSRGQESNSGRAINQPTPRTETPSRQVYDNGSNRSPNRSAASQSTQKPGNPSRQISRGEVNNGRNSAPAHTETGRSSQVQSRGAATATPQTEVRQNRSSKPAESRVSDRSSRTESAAQGRSGSSSRSAGNGRGNN
jgi:hypothetical protein